jgi:L-fuculose-phosphate aldolase
MWEVQKREVLEAAQRMAAKGLVTGTSGNVSRRITEEAGKGLIAITPSGCPYDSMTLDDIVVVDSDGKKIEGTLSPSIETMLHLGIYGARRKANAVVHTHAIFSSVIAVALAEIPPVLDDQMSYIGGEIKIASYALPGSRELVANVIDALGPRNAVIMANHGSLSVGRDVREALAICDLLEKTCQVYIHALTLGRMNKIPPEMAEVEKTFFSAIYGED